MIKKINIFLILVASIFSIYFAFKNDNIVFIIKDISVIFTISALYIIQRIFNIKINEGLNFVYILFIFMAHFLGVVVNLYDKIYWFDKFTHFLSGIVSSFFAIYILNITKNKNNKKIFFNILFIIAFTLMIASLWEMFEYISSYYFGVDPQKVAQTGVSDTMADIIVAFLGSILVSISYWFEYNNNCNLLIKKFEKLI